MKRKIVGLFLLLTHSIFAAGEVLGDAQQGVNETGGLIATGFVILVVLIWLVPFALSGAVYISAKKKREREHEEVGMAEAVKVLGTLIVSMAAAVYLVGTLGKYASGGTATTIAEGNGVFLKPFVDKGLGNLTGP